jgi:hypothetical protein
VQEISNRIQLEGAPTSTPTVTVASSSNVGVGTTTPSYDLQVDGAVAAESFVNVSTKTVKKNIDNVGASEREKLANKILDLDLKRYNYNSEASGSPKQLGVIAEQAPEEILSDSGKGVDLYEMTSATLASLQETSNTVESLQSQINNVTGNTDGSTTVVSKEPSDESILSVITGWLSDQATQIKNGVVAAADGVFGTITTDKLVIDSEPENGDTVSDQKDSTAGSGQIAENATSTTIENNQVATTSQVILTFTSQHDGAHWVDKRGGEFAVNMDEKQQATTTFDYLVIGVKDATARDKMASKTGEDSEVAGTSTVESGTTSTSGPDLGPLIDPDTYGTPPSEQKDNGRRPPTRSGDSDDTTSTTTATSTTDTSTTTDDQTITENDDTGSSTAISTDTNTETATTTDDGTASTTNSTASTTNSTSDPADDKTATTSQSMIGTDDTTTSTTTDDTTTDTASSTDDSS